MVNIAQRGLRNHVSVNVTVPNLVAERWKLPSSRIDEPVANLVLEDKVSKITSNEKKVAGAWFSLPG